MPGLRNRAFYREVGLVFRVLGMHSSAVDIHYSVVLVGFCRYNIHPGAVPTVAGVACHDRTVGRSFTPHHDAGAAFGVVKRLGLCRCQL